MDLGVARVFGRGPGEIAEIAVEIDIVLGHPADVGKAVGVDGVDHQQRDRLRPGVDDRLPDEGGLAARAAEALVAVRARDDDEEILRVHVAEAGDVRREFLALRASGASD